MLLVLLAASTDYTFAQVLNNNQMTPQKKILTLYLNHSFMGLCAVCMSFVLFIVTHVLKSFKTLFNVSLQA